MGFNFYIIIKLPAFIQEYGPKMEKALSLLQESARLMNSVKVNESRLQK
jgi:hypothetical protein